MVTVGFYIKSMGLIRRTLITIVLIALLGVTIMYVYEVWDSYQPREISPVGATVTEDVIRHDLSWINNKKVFSSDRAIHFYLYSDNTKLNTGGETLSSNEHVISLGIRMKKGTGEYNHLVSTGIQHAVLLWLYAMERDLPFPIAAVEVYTSTWEAFAVDSITMTRYEFDTIRSQFPNTPFDELNVEELAKLWKDMYFDKGYD